MSLNRTENITTYPELGSSPALAITAGMLDLAANSLPGSSGTATAAVVFLGALLFVGVTVGVTVYRNYESSKIFCASLNLFGKSLKDRLRQQDYPEAQPLVTMKKGSPTLV